MSLRFIPKNTGAINAPAAGGTGIPIHGDGKMGGGLVQVFGASELGAACFKNVNRCMFCVVAATPRQFFEQPQRAIRVIFCGARVVRKDKPRSK